MSLYVFIFLSMGSWTLHDIVDKCWLVSLPSLVSMVLVIHIELRVLLFLIAVLKGCGDNMFVVPIPLIVEDAMKVFDNIPEWNVVLWSNMIAGYALNNGILEPSSSRCRLDQD